VSDARHNYGAGRALAALELLADRTVSAPELAEALWINPRTARRLLRRLVRDGYAHASRGRVVRYTITSRLADLGERAKRQLATRT
jgi:DNA-binding IclR family transcriptional regulator